MVVDAHEAERKCGSHVEYLLPNLRINKASRNPYIQ